MTLSLKVVTRLTWNFNTYFRLWRRLRGGPVLQNNNSRWWQPPFWIFFDKV